MDRETFLVRVRGALEHARTQSPPPPPMVDEEIVRLAGPEDDLATVFTRRAEEVGMQVRRIAAGRLGAELVNVLREHDVKRVAASTNNLTQSSDLERVLELEGFELVDWLAADGLDGQFDLDAGITDVHAALAETGTLVCHSGAQHSRGLNLVPPLHVAIVRTSDIVPDMIDYWAQLTRGAATSLPSSITFITGPSKTADIEGQLVVGVHGPGTVVILLLEEP